MSVRSEFRDALRPHVPAEWTFFHYSPQLDNVGKTTLMLAQSTVRRSAGSPQGADDVTLTLTLVSPVQGAEVGEDALESALDQTLNGLDQLKNIVRGDASRRVYGDKFPCYDIDITLFQKRKQAN